MSFLGVKVDRGCTLLLVLPVTVEKQIWHYLQVVFIQTLYVYQVDMSLHIRQDCIFYCKEYKLLRYLHWFVTMIAKYV